MEVLRRSSGQASRPNAEWRRSLTGRYSHPCSNRPDRLRPLPRGALNRSIWMYWENAPGQPRPAYLDLCLETIRIRAESWDLHLLDKSTALEWLPDLDERMWNPLPSPALRANYIRTSLVYRHGGLWLDSDLIALSPLREIIDWLDEHEIVGWGREFNDFKVNLFASQANSVFSVNGSPGRMPCFRRAQIGAHCDGGSWPRRLRGRSLERTRRAGSPVAGSPLCTGRRGGNSCRGSFARTGVGRFADNRHALQRGHGPPLCVVCLGRSCSAAFAVAAHSLRHFDP
jgi:Capsular polysaccharide synthesis protein